MLAAETSSKEDQELHSNHADYMDKLAKGENCRKTQGPEIRDQNPCQLALPPDSRPSGAAAELPLLTVLLSLASHPLLSLIK